MFCLMKNRLQLFRAFNLGLGTFSPKATFLSHEMELLYTESLDFFFHGRESNVALEIINQSLKVKVSYFIASHIFLHILQRIVVNCKIKQKSSLLFYYIIEVTLYSQKLILAATKLSLFMSF